MSNQIEDLIANIQQKFDNQFSHTAQNSSAAKSQNIEKENKDNHNPEFQLANSINDVTFEPRTQNKQSIVIEQQHQNQQASHIDTNQSNLNDKDEQQNHYRQQLQNQHQQEQEDQNKYKDLSKKLETALKKISSSKKGFQSYNSFSHTSNFYSRAQQYQKKKQKDLQAKRKAEQQKKFHGLKSKPQINPKSRQMATQTSYRPIYQRFQQIVEQKKKKIQNHVQIKKNQEQEQYEKYLQQFKKHSKIQPESCRNSQTYFNDMMSWKNKLQKQRQEKLKQKAEKEKQGYTFKPEINKKSSKIINNQKRVPIQDRQIERPKTEQSQFTFQPKINKKKIQ